MSTAQSHAHNAPAQLFGTAGIAPMARPSPIARASVRMVLFVDFVKPTRQPAWLRNWLLLHLAVLTPFVRKGLDNHKAWERRFSAEAEAARNRWRRARTHRHGRACPGHRA